MNTRTLGFAVLLLASGGLHNTASASRYQDGSQYGYDLGSGGGVDSENIQSFCGPGFLNYCTPENLLVTDVLYNFSNFDFNNWNGFSMTISVVDFSQNVYPDNSIPIPGFENIACSGPTVPDSGDNLTGANFLCHLPSPLLTSSTGLGLGVSGRIATNQGFLAEGMFPVYSFDPFLPLDPGVLTSEQGLVRAFYIGDVVVPEPGTSVLLAAGIGGLFALRRKRRAS